MYSSRNIATFLKALNLNQLLLKLNQYICN
jgi:hypothetical protein